MPDLFPAFFYICKKNFAMRRLLMTLSAVLASATGVLADTLPYYVDSIRNVQYYPVSDFERETSLAVIEQEQSFSILYIVSLVVLVIIALLVWYVQNLKMKQFAKVLEIHSEELKRSKYQTDTFGYILNCSLFPCCLIDTDSKIAWCNEAFVNFYGKDMKHFDFASGAGQDFDVNSLKTSKVPVHYHVRVKDNYEKVFGFKRTVVPIKSDDGQTNYAVVENIAV